MELDEAITITKIITQTGPTYLLIGWQSKSFEMFIYKDNNIWKGQFSSERLEGFSKNLQMADSVYFENVKHCLSEHREDYVYELKSGFFYWRRKLSDSLILEGFLPVTLDKTSKISQTDLLEIIITLNKHLVGKINFLKDKLENTQQDYKKSIEDTAEFLNLKMNMEKALSEKFLSLLHFKKEH